MPGPLVSIRNISKRYRTRFDSRKILENVSLDVLDGARIALVGPNGSGKTTLLRILLEIDHPDAGTAHLDETLKGHSIAYVPQDYRNALFPWLRLSSNLALANGASVDARALMAKLSTDAKSRYMDLAAEFRVDLDLAKYPYQLSGGEQQIFLLIRAMIQNPRLLVLDEPLSAVDFGRRRFIQGFLGKWLHQTGCTLLFATHDFEEAVLLSDLVVVLCADSGLLKTTIRVDLPWPRGQSAKTEPKFIAAVSEIISTVI